MVPGLRPDWSIQTKRARVLINPTKVLLVLSKEHIRGRHWEAGEIVDHKGCWGSHIRNLHFLVTL